jgi:hypothetical protein
MQALMGGMGGGFLATVLVLGLGLASSRVRWSDGLGAEAQQMPVLSVMRSRRRRAGVDAKAMDMLRTRIKLLPARGGIEAGVGPRGRSIAVVRPAGGSAPGPLARELAESFARTAMSVLYVQADPEAAAEGASGWRDGLAGGRFEARREGGIWVLEAGGAGTGAAAEPSLAALRQGTAQLTGQYDLVVLEAGSLADSPSSELIASVADVALADVRRGDRARAVARGLERLAHRPRHAAAIAFGNAHRADPGLAA